MEKMKTEWENNYEKVLQKFRASGFLSLTAQDHKDMGSTPSKELKENPDKAQYEIMSDEKITKLLDDAIECMSDETLIKSGFAKSQKNFFIVSLPYLKSVGRLPAKFENFDLDSLPDLK
jgi:hypothetical protein